MSKQIGAFKRQRKHDVAVVKQAVDAVVSGSMSMRAASELYGVPKSTLNDKVLGKSPMVRPSKTVLSAPEEQRLVDWVIHMARIRYGRTRHEV